MHETLPPGLFVPRAQINRPRAEAPKITQRVILSFGSFRSLYFVNTVECLECPPFLSQLRWAPEGKLRNYYEYKGLSSRKCFRKRDIFKPHVEHWASNTAPETKGKLNKPWNSCSRIEQYGSWAAWEREITLSGGEVAFAMDNSFGDSPSNYTVFLFLRNVCQHHTNWIIYLEFIRQLNQTLE